MNNMVTDFVDDFLRGQMDCQKGVQHTEGKSEAYNRGYAAQYEHEQQQTWLSERIAK